MTENLTLRRQAWEAKLTILRVVGALAVLFLLICWMCFWLVFTVNHMDRSMIWFPIGVFMIFPVPCVVAGFAILRIWPDIVN